METDIMFVRGCLDCPFYSLREKLGDAGYTDHSTIGWCSNLDKQVKQYITNRMAKDCPLRIKNITIAADLEK